MGAGTYSCSTAGDAGQVTSSLDASQTSTIRWESIPAAKGPEGEEGGP